jgi:hypothetical protein
MPVSFQQEPGRPATTRQTLCLDRKFRELCRSFVRNVIRSTLCNLQRILNRNGLNDHRSLDVSAVTAHLYAYAESDDRAAMGTLILNDQRTFKTASLTLK